MYTVTECLGRKFGWVVPQYGYFVMFCAPNAKIMTDVSEKSYTPKIRLLTGLD